ncbi:hypothetical protein J437_LFUL002864 [Ladona fulva]|uniref:Transmembrane protein n=1 Tax=Ladona fulva TaxID=123851 RepID=A0A8K0JZZ3_LADFU|nr:hypothetical protein J437_LFUL002864 [Ladona fulva]
MDYLSHIVATLFRTPKSVRFCFRTALTDFFLSLYVVYFSHQFSVNSKISSFSTEILSSHSVLENLETVLKYFKHFYTYLNFPISCVKTKNKKIFFEVSFVFSIHQVQYPKCIFSQYIFFLIKDFFNVNHDMAKASTQLHHQKIILLLNINLVYSEDSLILMLQNNITIIASICSLHIYFVK